MIRSDPQLINAEDPSGTRPLFFAVRHQVPLITQYLIENGEEKRVGTKKGDRH